MTLVQDFLDASVQRSPDKLALVCDDRRLTYAELGRAADSLANALAARGVVRGDRVAIWLENSPEAVIGLFAALKANAVFVVLHPTTKPEKLAYILNNCQAKALLFDGRKAALLDPLAAEVPGLSVRIACGRARGSAPHPACLAFDDLLTSYPADCPPRRNIDLDLACLIYTSGSTGGPKGVMSDHANVVFASGAIIEYLHNTADDVVICALPLSFDYGLYQVLMTVRFGGTLVLERGFAYPAAVLQHMEAEHVTGLPLVPTMLALLLQMDLSGFDLSALRYATNTAAALPPSHIQEFRRRFPQVALYSMYGLTETKRTLYLPPDQLERRPGSVGVPIPGTEVWLEDESGRRVGPGEVGELVIRGRHVMRGYWGDPEATAATFRPGPLPGERVCYSGDLFCADADGYYTFVGRKDDIIKCRGEKVSPKEIESVLYQLPQVLEAAVVGVPDPVLGQAVKALVVSRDGSLTEAAVLAHCRAHLEDLLVPKFVEFRDTLPKTSSGKIQKRGLA